MRRPTTATGMRPRRPALAATAVATLLLAGCSATGADEPTRGADQQGYVGSDGALTRIAPDQRIPGPTVSGVRLGDDKQTVSTADYPGKVVVINVWGAWCAPCRLEAPDLAEASRKRADTAAFVGINVRESSPETAQAFLRTFDIDYPHIYDPGAAQLVRFAGTLPPNGIPTTLLIDRQGRVAARVVGVVSLTTLLGLIDETYEGK